MKKLEAHVVSCQPPLCSHEDGGGLQVLLEESRGGLGVFCRLSKQCQAWLS